MTKKQLILTIDEELIADAKKQIPNISGFVETCLKQYLGVGNELTPTSKMHELVETISKCQLQLYLMNEKGNIEKEKEKAQLHEINFAWRQLYTEYRDTRTINPDKLKHASEILKVSCDELTDIVEVVFVYRDTSSVDVTDWFSVYNEYGYGDE
jgi:hypothetical protein